jgi:hypothetical protein
MPKPKKTPTISPISFIDSLIKKNELGQPFTLMDHQRDILRLAFAFDENGRLCGTRSSIHASRSPARPRSMVP